MHSFRNSANDRKIDVAFRAVLVMLMVSAPNDFVMAAEQLDLRKLVVKNNAMARAFLAIDHIGGSPSSILRSIPGRAR